MQTLLVARDPADAQSTLRGIQALGILEPQRALSFEAAMDVIRADRSTSLLTVFFCGKTFTSDDLATLKQLCLLQPERVKLVAVGAANAPERVLETIRCGAIDYLDVASHFDIALKEVVERIRTIERREKKLGRLFCVVSPVGGAGTSTLACNIAAVLALKEGGCGLIDLHPRGGDLAGLLNLQPRHSLGSIAGRIQQLDAAMFEQTLTSHGSGISLLASPEPLSDFRQLTIEAANRILHFARERFTSVVADLEDIEHGEQIRTLGACDRVIIPLRADFIAISRCKRWLEYLGRAKISREHISIVINRVGQPKELPLDFIRKALGDELRCAIPNTPEIVQEAYNLGAPFVISNPESAASIGIRHLVSDLLGEPREESRRIRGKSWFGALRDFPVRLQALRPLVNSSNSSATRSVST